MQGSGQLCWGRAGWARPGSGSHGCTRLPCPQVGWGHLAGEGPVMLCSDPAAQILPTRVSLQPHVRDLWVRAGAGGWERYPRSSGPRTSLLWNRRPLVQAICSPAQTSLPSSCTQS